MPAQRLVHAAAAMLVVVSIALTGCTATQAVTVGDADKSTKSAAPVQDGSRRVLTKSEAQSVMPTAIEIGTGWLDGKNPSSTDSGDDGSTSSSTYSPKTCAFSASNGAVSDLTIVPASKKPVASAEADFHSQPDSDDSLGLTVRSLNVKVSSYKDGVDAGKLQQIADRLKTCATFTSTDSSSGVSANWQIFPDSLPNYGDGTLAFKMQGSVSFFIVLLDSVQIVAGHNVVSITQSGVGKIDPALGASVAKTVMAKLEAATKK